MIKHKVGILEYLMYIENKDCKINKLFNDLILVVNVIKMQRI